MSIPTEPGFYWVKLPGLRPWVIGEIREECGCVFTTGADEPYWPDDLAGAKFSQRLTPPE